MSFYALLSMHCEHAQLPLEQPNLDQDKQANIQMIVDCFATVRRELAMKTLDLGYLDNMPKLEDGVSAEEGQCRYQLSTLESTKLIDTVSELTIVFGQDRSIDREQINLLRKLAIL